MSTIAQEMQDGIDAVTRILAGGQKTCLDINNPFVRQMLCELRNAAQRRLIEEREELRHERALAVDAGMRDAATANATLCLYEAHYDARAAMYRE